MTARRRRNTTAGGRTARRSRLLRTCVLNLRSRVGRNRVPTTAAPRVTAGDATGGEPRAPQCPVALERFETVRRAGRVVTAGRRAAGGCAAVEPDQRHQRPGRGRRPRMGETRAGERG